MRPLKGRPTRGRQRIIMTRIPKQQEPLEVNEDEHKKMTGPLKKRPIITKKVAVTPIKKNEDIELANMKPRGTVAMNRARRTPKPNPKYSNENVISLNIRSSSKRGKSEFSDSDDDELMCDDDDQSVDSAMMDEIRDEESSDNPLDEDPLPSKPPVMGKRRAGRPPKVNRDILGSLKDDRKSSPPTKIKQTGKPLEVYKRILARNRRNSDLFDANESDNSISVVPSESIRGQPKSSTKRSSDSPSLKTQSGQRSEGKSESIKGKKNYSDDEMTTGAASTIDDFETMPTFTIVNIHDIINKKRDVLIAKSPSWQEKPPGRKNNDDSKDKFDDAQQERESKDTSPQLSRNRRKSLHTTILSDKIDHSKLATSTPKSSLPIRKPTPIDNDSKKSSEAEKQLISMNYKSYKAAPRILNSYIAKKTKPIPSVIKLETKERKRDFEGNLQSKENFHLNTGSTSNNNNTSTKSNNNLGINTKQLTNNTSNSSNNVGNSRSASKTISSSNIGTTTMMTTTSSPESKSKMGTIAKSIMNNLGNNTATIGNNIQVRKIVPSKDVSPQQQQQQQQQQLQQQQPEAKKVLSVETWTIVETPQPSYDYVERKPVLSFTLTKLGNNVKKIKLPSPSWSYRVALQKVPFDPDAEEFYTGETPKIKMKDSDNGMLQPVSIMFRRKVHGSTANSQFDRSVTFRDTGFNISMNGKCVSLAGAPSTIDSLDDIECLLNVVDHLTLKDTFVEVLKPTMII